MAQKIRLALLGLWIGAMSFFSFFVAPSAFAVLPSHQAGAIVSRTLAGLEVLGLALGAIILMIVLAAPASRGKAKLFESVMIGLMLAAMAVSRLIVSARLHDMRVRLGETLATLPPTDPTRATFDLLHRVSVGLMSFTLLAALILAALLVWHERVVRNRA
jgi:hypothetical protein